MLFRLSVSLEFVVIDILALLLRKKLLNRFILVMTDRYLKLTWVIPVAKITARNVATVILENWVIYYEAPDFILTDNGKQFTSKFFAALYASLEAKLVTTTEYHLQINGQVEQ